MRAEDPEDLNVGDRELEQASRLGQGFALKGNLGLNLVICDVTIKERERFAIRIRVHEVHFMFTLLCMILNIFIALSLYERARDLFFYEPA